MSKYVTSRETLLWANGWAIKTRHGDGKTEEDTVMRTCKVEVSGHRQTGRPKEEIGKKT